MILIEDTRQQDGKHCLLHNRFEDMGVCLDRCTLPFGDYALPPRISVDTKRNILEIVGNINNDHQRFKGECERAKRAGCHLYILIENEEQIMSVDDMVKWKDPLYYKRRVPVTGARIKKAMETMHSRYGVTFMFCHPENTSEMIMRILNGEFE